MLAPPHDPYDFPGDEGPPDQGTGPTEKPHCIEVDWPGKSLWPTMERQSRWHTPNHWSGSLLLHSRDPSGQYYRRNRFYDAGSGRFTQEDPIGIAGGLNVYGYANGDPVSYSDPFGLCPYEGKDRTADVESCPDDDRKSVFRVLQEHHPATVEAVRERRLNVVMSDDLVCGRVKANGCAHLSRGTIALQSGRGVGETAASVAHETFHFVNWGVSARNPNIIMNSWSTDEAMATAVGWSVYSTFPAPLRQDRTSNYWSGRFTRDPAGTLGAYCVALGRSDC